MGLAVQQDPCWLDKGMCRRVCCTLLALVQAAEAELSKNQGVVINVSSAVAIAASQTPAMTPYYWRVCLLSGLPMCCLCGLQLGLQHGLEPFSLVDAASCITAEAVAEFQGLAVLDEGNPAVTQALERAGVLLEVCHVLSTA